MGTTRGSGRRRGPRLALPIIGADTFFLINGDTLTDVDVDALSESHLVAGALVTLALVPNRDPHRYGGVRLDDRQRVVGFAARGAAAEGSYHFIGVQVVHSSVFSSLPAGQPAQSIGGVYDALIADQPGAVHGFVCDAAFWDVGTLSDYWSTSWSFVHAQDGADVTCGRGARIDPTARVSRSILWDDVEVSRNCVLDECVLTDGVFVPAGAKYRRTILLRAPDDTIRTAPLPI